MTQINNKKSTGLTKTCTFIFEGGIIMKIKANEILNNVKKETVKRSPEILLGLGITGMLTSVVLAVKATPKVYELIKDENYIREKSGEPELTKTEIIKMSWKPYLPAALSFSVSAACLIGANNINTKRNALLATAYTLSEKALVEYKDKVIEVVGEEKEKEIRDKVSKDRMAKDSVKNHEVIITNKGDTLCYDTISGRYFKSDVDKIKKAENIVNHTLITNDYCSLNEFYDEIGLDATEMGSAIGWNVDNGLIEIYFSAQIADDGQPCVVVNYDIQPTYHFDKIN